MRSAWPAMHAAPRSGAVECGGCRRGDRPAAFPLGSSLRALTTKNEARRRVAVTCAERRGQMKPRQDQGTLVLVGLLAAMFFAIPLAAQTPPPCNTGPLAEADVIKLVVNPVPEKRIVHMVDSCGVSFPLTPENEKTLRAAGASDAVITAIANKSAEKNKTVVLGGIPSATSWEENPRRIKVSESVQEGRIISQTPPVYPILARQARISGTVRLHAIIAEDGSVDELEVVSGHPLLLKAALDAASEWKYQPTLLNGEPVKVDTTV